MWGCRHEAGAAAAGERHQRVPHLVGQLPLLHPLCELPPTWCAVLLSLTLTLSSSFQQLLRLQLAPVHSWPQQGLRSVDLDLGMCGFHVPDACSTAALERLISHSNSQLEQHSAHCKPLAAAMMAAL